MSSSFMTPRALRLALVTTTALTLASAAYAQSDGLLFSLSGDKGLTADRAAGMAGPIFAEGVDVVADGAAGPALRASDDQVLAWSGPANIYAQRGTVSFFWRARTPVGRSAFPIFRVGYADHTSWDMVWLRIDWNGHGFDAFVTDTNLARTRVSFDAPAPSPETWTHLAFAWDETQGVQLFVNGKPAARKDAKTTLDAGLFGFGPHSRVISPYQVQSAYNYRRGGDIDELKIYDHRLAETEVASLAAKTEVASPAPRRDLSEPRWRDEWWMRYGWNRPGDLPAYLAAAATKIRKVEFADTRDLKMRMFRGADGIRETTWPGVYNRSRLAGRHDYFELPDWNVYADGGKAYDLTLPDEPWNTLEITGAAYGALSFTPTGGRQTTIGARPAGQERTSTRLPAPLGAGVLRFSNTAQETPIQEIAAYNVTPGEEPKDAFKLSYQVRASAGAAYPTLTELNGFIAGRYVADERATVVALPAGAPSAPRAKTSGPQLPLVHVLIPADFRDVAPGGSVARYSYGWENLNAGLDGLAIDLPALDVKPTHGEFFLLNIRVKDPSWPERDLLDVNVAVKPNEARTLWLDTRDRILPDGKSLYLTLAGSGGDFGPASVDGLRVRLVFKDRKAAAPEHIADRFEQARDNLSFLVEEQPNIRLYPTWTRFERDISDVLKVDPDNAVARSYWVEKNPEQPYAPFVQPEPPAGVPLWAFRQTEDLKLASRFVRWWIDNRQIANGEFGGGLSDDVDLTNQWVGLAEMGVDPEGLARSQRRMLDETYVNGMWSNGLGRIRTDELHTYEEGINAVAQGMMLQFGDPKTVERAMETARNYDRLYQVNPAGHRHPVSSYYSGDDIVRESVWEWGKPYSYLVLHPGLLLGEYWGSAKIKQTVLELADGYLAHGKQAADGTWTFPAEIHWRTDADRGSGFASSIHVFWAAYKWTGDEKYLRPLNGEVAKGDWSSLLLLNADVLGLANRKDSWGAKLSALAAPKASLTGRGGDLADYARFERWRETGDKSILADIYGREIALDSQRMHLITEGHLWSDRVNVPWSILQRSRLGGIAHNRNQYFPGNLVSWRFDRPDAAEQVAILIPQSTPKAFKAVLFNLANRPVKATLVGADVAAGRWTLSEGVDANGDDKADAPTQRSVVLERSAGIDIVLPPGQTTVLDLALDTAWEDPSTRPDIGVGTDDLRLTKGRLTATVHSLGSKPAPAGTLVLETAVGATIASAPIPPLPSAADLTPKTVEVRLNLPAKAAPGDYRVRLKLEGDVREVTQANNLVPLSLPPTR
ncbi:LamG-like jellyroll fold domain-containing protein [Caulobacter sp.]|uniref:LamG-like jellyroll fold domain-containing protein n=1 Tax=Caulobacter sp. TaxID=78 RepID=UPI001B15562F|nr:LamG-like jellyroll fold domain-containing protein [Caulobacter sp.]MBO9546363.1 LamG domain-containing protein [Caulobacter sp.]